MLIKRRHSTLCEPVVKPDLFLSISLKYKMLSYVMSTMHARTHTHTHNLDRHQNGALILQQQQQQQQLSNSKSNGVRRRRQLRLSTRRAKKTNSKETAHTHLTHVCVCVRERERVKMGKKTCRLSSQSVVDVLSPSLGDRRRDSGVAARWGSGRTDGRLCVPLVITLRDYAFNANLDRLGCIVPSDTFN